MKGTIHLKKPLCVAGRTYKELRYNTDIITLDQFEYAAQQSKGGTAILETDHAFHVRLGVMAVCSEMESEMIPEDIINALAGADIIAFAQVGRNFTLGVSEEDLGLKTSEAPEEIMPESITPESGM